MKKANLDSSERTVLIVAPHFPPSTVAGVHRPRHLAKWLPAHGWSPVIIRVDEKHYTEKLDPELARLVPDSVNQERIGAINASLARSVGITDIGLRSYFEIRAAIARCAEKYAPSAVLITGSPYYPMMLSGWIKRRFGLPVVLDFQDPWVSNWGGGLPKLSKGGIVHQLAVLLEPRALRHADFVTSVSDQQNEELAARYPWLDGGKMAGIPIGGDPEDYDRLRELGATGGWSTQLQPSKITITYVGTFLPRAEPVIRRLFRAIALLVARSPGLKDKLQLKFIGTSNQTEGTRKTVLPIAEAEGIGELVDELPNRIPFLDALALLARSTGLMLIGSDEPHYTASKIYPALMSGSPFISIFHSQSSAHKILSNAGGGRAIDFNTIDDLDRKVPEIAKAFETLIEGEQRFNRVDPLAYADFTADAVSKGFAEVFEKISR